ncbi:hypothetical protein Agub_g13427, partial [Astrephomene gubernaculifera]
ISKAGGTSWTAAARANSCSVPPTRGAHLPHSDDECRWVRARLLAGLLRGAGGHWEAQRVEAAPVCPRYGIVERRTLMRDCIQRLDAVHSRGHHYISNEYTLHGGEGSMYDTHLCPQFVNVISIREPLARLVSNIKYIMLHLKHSLFHTSPATSPALERAFNRTFCNAPAKIWELLAPPVVDNYNVRSMLGESAFHSPLWTGL